MWCSAASRLSTSPAATSPCSRNLTSACLPNACAPAWTKPSPRLPGKQPPPRSLNIHHMHGPNGVPKDQVEAQLERILVSRTFVHSERLRRFLRFCVEQTIAGRTNNLREYNIAREVFDRPVSYNPASDPIVRVEARRLRL